MRQRNTLVECGFGIVSTARLGCKLGHVWTASRMQTCLVLQTLVRREAVWGNCPWINVPECWRRLVLCGGPWMTNMKSLSQIQTACQLLPGTRLVAKSKLGRLRQFENTWHGAEPNWQIAATTWWHEKWHMQIRDQHWQVLRPTWPKGWCQGLHSLKPMKDHRSHDAWSGGFSSGHGHKIRVTVIKWKFGWGCDLQLGIFHSHIWLAEGQHFDPSNHKKIIRSDQCHIRQVPAAISTMLHGSNFSKLSRAIQRQWWLYDCDPFFSTWNSMWLWTCHYIDGFASNSDEGKKRILNEMKKSNDPKAIAYSLFVFPLRVFGPVKYISGHVCCCIFQIHRLVHTSGNGNFRPVSFGRCYRPNPEKTWKNLAPGTITYKPTASEYSKMVRCMCAKNHQSSPRPPEMRLPLSTADRALANSSVNLFKSFNVC